jgi:hypothetical protein
VDGFDSDGERWEDDDPHDADARRTRKIWMKGATPTRRMATVRMALINLERRGTRIRGSLMQPVGCSPARLGTEDLEVLADEPVEPMQAWRGGCLVRSPDVG